DAVEACPRRLCGRRRHGRRRAGDRLPLHVATHRGGDRRLRAVLRAGGPRVNLAHRLRTSIVLHYVRYRLGIDKARSQTTPGERVLLRKLAAKARTIVEIGAFEGVTTRAIREAMPPEARMYAVDPFPPNRYGFNVQHGIFWSEVNRSTNGRVMLLRQYSYQ